MRIVNGFEEDEETFVKKRPFDKGQPIEHETFGKGVVMDYKDGEVLVAFQDPFCIKKIMASSLKK